MLCEIRLSRTAGGNKLPFKFLADAAFTRDIVYVGVSQPLQNRGPVNPFL